MDELIPTRNEKGQMLPGFVPGKTGRQKGSLNRVTSLMKMALADAIENGGPESNPLLILLTIAKNEKHSALVRMHAADRLCRYLAPRLISIEHETSEGTGGAQVVIQALQCLLTPASDGAAAQIEAPHAN